jgi:hypothetical protein
LHNFLFNPEYGGSTFPRNITKHPSDDIKYHSRRWHSSNSISKGLNSLRIVPNSKFSWWWWWSCRFHLNKENLLTTQGVKNHTLYSLYIYILITLLMQTPANYETEKVCCFTFWTWILVPVTKPPLLLHHNVRATIQGDKVWQ